MTADRGVEAARIAADAARERLMATAGELQERLRPRALARDAWEGAKIKGADLAEEAVDAVKARPLAATGIAAAIGLFLAREPIIEAAGKLLDNMDDKRAAKKQRKAANKKSKKVEKSK